MSALASALASLAGGICDRYGRANVVTAGVLLCALVCLFGFPNVDSGWGVGILYSLLGSIEGTVLVAAPALIRDFRPPPARRGPPLAGSARPPPRLDLLAYGLEIRCIRREGAMKPAARRVYRRGRSTSGPRKELPR